MGLRHSGRITVARDLFIFGDRKFFPFYVDPVMNKQISIHLIARLKYHIFLDN